MRRCILIVVSREGVGQSSTGTRYLLTYVIGDSGIGVCINYDGRILAQGTLLSDIERVTHRRATAHIAGNNDISQAVRQDDQCWSDGRVAQAFGLSQPQPLQQSSSQRSAAAHVQFFYATARPRKIARRRQHDASLSKTEDEHGHSVASLIGALQES